MIVVCNSKNKKLQNAHRWLQTSMKLLPLVNTLHSYHSDKNVQKFLQLLDHCLKHYGEKATITLLKEYKLHIQQHALGQKVTELSMFQKRDKDNFVKALNPWKVNVNSATDDIRYILSFWRILDAFRCKPEYKVESITNKSTADESLVEELCNFIMTWRPLESLSQDRSGHLVLSNRAGPNGPASASCLDDLKPIRASGNLQYAIQELLDESVRGLDMDLYKSGDGKTHSKLVLLSDNACKTRVIAIADWWSNCALSGLHENFMKFLKEHPSDVTFRQHKIPNLIQGLGNHLYSSDMTAFTDRFPIKLEEAIVKAAYGPRTSRLWSQVISNRVFTHPLGGVKYSVGNPMGILSSWPISTTTHHAVKAWCAHKLGKPNYKYMILGDDTLDSCKDVYDLYIDTIKKLGVSISLSKCTQSENGNTEFAKRIFIQHVEVTGLPINLLEELYTKPEQFIELIRICRERGYKDEYLVPGVLSILKYHKNGKLISDILSLPLSISGTPPLLEANAGSWADIINNINSDYHNDMLLQCRNYIFWKEVDALNKAPIRIPNQVEQVVLSETHPLVYAISNKLDNYLDLEGGEFAIYDEWMKGNYREMAKVPNVDTYRYKNKGHKVTKSKYEVLKAVLALAKNDHNIPLHYPTRISNYDLFIKGFPSIT
jgi:hypothetical protein